MTRDFEEHAELEILDQLGLTDTPRAIKLKELLLGTGDATEESLQVLASAIQTRVDEGQGETLFDLGLEDDETSRDLAAQRPDSLTEGALVRVIQQPGEPEAERARP